MESIRRPLLGDSYVRRTILLACTVLGLLPAGGRVRAAVRPAAAAAVAPLDPQVLASLEWRPIGPARFGGRVTDIAAVETRPAVFYVGTASGGLWKTTNLGTSWKPVFDDAACASIGDVALAPSNPEVVWVGTGEANNSQNSPWGNGVYRSIDGGRTWSHLGLEETRHIGRVVVHPKDPDVAYVAAAGHLWGPNPERGVYRTRDGGRTWKKVLFVDADTGAIDLVIDPGDPQVMFAATYQRRRYPWGLRNAGPGSGIYRTRDGGDSWTRLVDGLPGGDLGRIALDVYRRDPRIVYAEIEAAGGAGGVYRSADGGSHWEHLSDLRRWPSSSYFGQLRIDPSDDKRIYVAGRPLSLSDDGGRTFRDTAARGVHSDEHALWIDPANSSFLILGNDGGVYVSFDRSESWRMLDNLPLGQYYAIGADMQDPYWVCGGLQDNGGWCGPSASRFGGGIGNYDWVNVVGADGFYVLPDPKDARILYAEWQEGRIVRVDRATGERKPIQPSAAPGEAPYRWNFSTPFLISTHDSATLYAGANVVLKTSDRGSSWTRISPDLSRSKGRPPVPNPVSAQDDSTLGRYGTLTTLAESALNPKVLYAGTDDGALHGTRDGGASWSELTAAIGGLPPGTYVSRVQASRHAEGTVYASFDGHYQDDYKAYVYVSSDFGRSWRAIAGGLPDWSVNVILEHPRNPDLLFVGNEVGVFVSVDRGSSWSALKNNLPTVPVDDMLIHPRENDLVLGTHGRSLWILDDIAPLEELSPATLAESAHLFGVRRATLFNYPPTPLSERVGIDPGPRYWNSGTFAAPNPAPGAAIRYYLKQDLGAPARITIADREGRTLRELLGPGKPGIQEVQWDLRMQPAVGSQPAPRVLPGSYRVRLSAGAATRERELGVRLDPLANIGEAELLARQRALLDLHGLARPIADALAELERLGREIQAAQAAPRGEAPAMPRQTADSLEAVAAEVRRIQKGLGDQRSRRGSLFASLDGAHAPPRPDELRDIDALYQQARDSVEQIETLRRGPLAELQQALRPLGVRIEAGPGLEPPKRRAGP